MNSGDEVGKVVYKVELDTSQLEQDMDYISKRLDGELPQVKPINLEVGHDVVAEFQQIEAAVNQASQTILYMTHGLGDLQTDASETGMAIAQMMSKFRQGGGDLDMLIDKLKSMGEAAGVDSNGQLFNGLYELRDRAQSLAEELSTLTEGTAEYKIKETEAAQAAVELQNALHTLDSSYKPLYTSIESYEKSTEKAKQATEGLNEEQEKSANVVPNMARQLATIWASFNTLKRSVSLVTESLSEYREVQESIASNNSGEYMSPLTSSWNELEKSISNVKLTIATAFEPFAEGVSTISELISTHRELIAGLAVGTTTLLAVAGAVGVVTASLKALGVTVTWTKAQILGFIGIVGGILGVIAGFIAYNNVASSSLDEETIALNNADEEARKYADSMVAAQKATSGATKSTKDYSKQLQKLRRNFLESLKQIAVNHEETIDDIQADLEELRVDYENTIAERNASFNVTMAEEERSHQELVDELTTQLNFLQRYNNAYNAEKLARVQFALEKEQYLYAQETEARKAELDAQNAADKASYEQRLSELQAELADELSFMEKHREDLNMVRDVILLDEIDMLKRQYEEQVAAYAEQEAAASASGATISKTWEDYYDEMMDKVKATSATTNQIIANETEGWIKDVAETWNNFWNGVGTALDGLSKSLSTPGSNWFSAMAQSIFNAVTARPDLNDTVWKAWEENGSKAFASGGYTGYGPKYEVAGIVHRGEYVVPQEEVDQETGTPKMGNVQNITINLEGTFATSSQERRKVAQQIADALAQLNKAGRTVSWQ